MVWKCEAVGCANNLRIMGSPLGVGTGRIMSYSHISAFPRGRALARCLNTS